MSKNNKNWFSEVRYGLVIHYGLYSLLERGEWAWNREEISRDEYKALANRFTAENFDADRLCRLAVDAGMRYVVFTTMHHEGFRLYPTKLSDFHIGESAAKGRDLVAEIIAAARKRGLKVGLYHSLNNWYDQPDAVAALEDRVAYTAFIQATHERIRELVTRYNPIDILWYDGWWPFNGEKWQAEKMNGMVRDVQPHILFNGRNGLPGDFATPEQHLGAPRPWRPWEACMTLNNSWGYHAGDHDWKSAAQVIDLLAACAQGIGNLLLNVGPRGDGSIPEESVRILETAGDWLKRHGECIFDTEPFTYDLQERGDHRGDWNFHGPMTVRGNTLYWLLRRWPGETAILGGLECEVQRASFVGSGGQISFSQTAGRLMLTGLPANPPDAVCPVICLECDRPPTMYLSGGLRVPAVPHPHYDPCPSDIEH